MFPRTLGGNRQTSNRRKFRSFLFCVIGVFFLFYLSSLLFAFHSLARIETASKFSSSGKQQNQHQRPLSSTNQADWILQNWEQHVQDLHEWLQKDISQLPTKPITAFLEAPLNATKPGTGSRTPGAGAAPEYYEPLPLRTQTPKDLRKVVYPKLQSCKDIPALLPVDRGRQVDPVTGEIVPWNVGEEPTPSDYVDQELPYCPVDADPFLPWIHDVFWLKSHVHFIAQNKRRCKTGEGCGSDLERLEPQVALLQSVSVQRLTNKQAQQLAPEVWTSNLSSESIRYRLAPYEEANINATRFICKFHTWSPTSSRIDIGETLSEFPFNYEYAAFRKHTNRPGLLSRHGKDNGKFWTSTLMFSCPIPDGISQYKHAIGGMDMPVLYVDIIPIRTPPRYPIETSTGDIIDPGHYFHPSWAGPANVGRFDPIQAWGSRHVLPEIEASGRWQNIPACPMVEKDRVATVEIDAKGEQASTKPHLLSACLWAAASFRTRGAGKELTSDTKARLKEWIDFHLLVGFDHIYVYDNSAAHTNETDLSDITDLYDDSQVTRIEWPFVVCNNNIPANDNTGERSSQYAAENSCRSRFAHRTEWIASIDTDEYLVPMGEHTSLRTVVENAKDTNILSFRSTRGKLRYSASEPTERNGRKMSSNVTFLEAYNCDSAEAPRPEHADRARKQLYRADYVLNHFVHYSTVTKAYLSMYIDNPQGWTKLVDDPTERVVDESHEATMIHTKKVELGQTMNYRKRCNVGFKKRWLGCYVGFPWPDNKKVEGLNQTDGTEYNCFVNKKVEEYWLPRLKESILKHGVSP